MGVTAYKVTGLLTWKQVTDRTEFKARLRRMVRTATKRNATEAQKKVLQAIKKPEFQKNADLTIAIKGSAAPLIHSGKMLKDIQVRQLSPDSYAVGIPVSSESYKAAAIVHEGAVIPVSNKMRAMFMVLHQASTGQIDSTKLEGRAAELFARHQNWLPLSAGTQVIIIPARPFIYQVFRDRKFIADCKRRWIDAVQRALTPIARRTRFDKGNQSGA